MDDAVVELLAGPRGRRLCLELAKTLSPRAAELVFWLGFEFDPVRGTSRVLLTADGRKASAVDSRPAVSTDQLARVLTGMDLSGITDEQIQAGLAEAVATAMYWQEPDGEDVLAGHRSIHGALGPVAERVLDSSPARHWGQPRQAVQWVIDWRLPEDLAPLPRDPQRVLAVWARDERAEEARAVNERPTDPEALYSGNWWSIPQDLILSVGQIPAGLDLIEDSFGWDAATVIPVRGAGRTYEIHTPKDWVRLCREQPLEVSASRRHDWYRVTGRTGRWVIPDWEQVASEWDAVHLTTLGYLSAATRELPVDTDTATVIAGWNPTPPSGSPTPSAKRTSPDNNGTANPATTPGPGTNLSTPATKATPTTALTREAATEVRRRRKVGQCDIDFPGCPARAIRTGIGRRSSLLPPLREQDF
ncbi:hypothetical protein [uncultured Citricoccus sp.]|uniref:hypothetical protein n=1 Tax=uncultured Citricoccus sp. TaxID=614031 RepID=UPI0026307D03|nr:hypothetical protein [uncultured Citricoccus sp.]